MKDALYYKDNLVEVIFSGENPPYLEFEVGRTFFYGACDKSPNGKYIVSSMTGGAKNNGYCVLISGDQFLFSGKVPNPRKALVSDVGVFIVHDCKFPGDDSGSLITTVLIYDQDGNKLFSKKTKALINTIGISADGKYAAFLTAGGDFPDACVLHLVDIERRKVVWTHPAGWSTRIDFEVSNINVVVSTIGKGIQVSYSIEKTALKG